MTSAQAAGLIETIEAMLDGISKKEGVAEHLVQIGRLQQEIAPVASPQLNHFLQNRSYTKALEYLKNGVVVEDPDRPDCEGDHP